MSHEFGETKELSINKTELKTALNSLLICLVSPNSGYEAGVLQLPK